MNLVARALPNILHAIAAGVTIAVLALVFLYTGDNDLMFAAACGMSGGLLIYIVAHLRSIGRPDNH